MKRILIYSHDTFGLGNIRRMTAIAEHLVASNPRLTVLILSGSPMLQSFRIAPRIDYVKLPCLKRDAQGEYGVKSLGLTLRSVVQLRANLINCAMQEYSPDLILVDKKPFGVSDELEPALRWLRFRKGTTRVVLLLRDILDEPAATIRIWKKNNYHQIIRDLYDLILVVGNQDIFDLGDEYQFPPSSLRKLHYCGYLRRSVPNTGSLALARDDTPAVLVTAGGGEDGINLLANYLLGLANVRRQETFASKILLGPEMPAPQRAYLLQLAARCPNVEILDFSPDPMQFMAAADVVVAMAGYNTVCEILSLNKPAVVVPRTEPVREQWIRAQRLAERNLMRCIDPAQLTPDSLMTAVLEKLQFVGPPRPAKKTTDMAGLDRIARHIRHLLENASPAQIDVPFDRSIVLSTATQVI